ncbi:MAG: hypothetical protein WAL66_03715 [Nitrososphaeraceae archaeon]
MYWNILNHAYHIYIHVPNTIDLQACERYGFNPNELAGTRQSVIGHMVMDYTKEYKIMQDLKDKYLHLSNQYYKYGFVMEEYESSV